MFIILNLRNILDNFIKYGIQFKQDPGEFVPLHTVLFILALGLFPLISLFVEKMKFKKLISVTFAVIIRINIENTSEY